MTLPFFMVYNSVTLRTFQPFHVYEDSYPTKKDSFSEFCRKNTGYSYLLR